MGDISSIAGMKKTAAQEIAPAVQALQEVGAKISYPLFSSALAPGVTQKRRGTGICWSLPKTCQNARWNVTEKPKISFRKNGEAGSLSWQKPRKSSRLYCHRFT